MAGPSKSELEGEGEEITHAQIDQMAVDITDEALKEVLRDIVLEVYRKEKQARAQSAVIIAEQGAERNNSGSETPEKGTGDSKPNPSKGINIETEAVIIRDGKAYLKGNPMQTTKEIYCPDCNLPRLLYPTTGIGARPPPDPDREYCKKRPSVIKEGHDVFGNLFASDKVKSKKKQNAERAGSSSPSEPATPLKNSFSNSQKELASERPGIPSHKCPNCPRYMTLNRIAQHLDKCMGISGRQAGRNAMNKMTGTPSGSRASTPKPSLPPLKRARPGDGDDNEGNPTKKKKLSTPKKSKLGPGSGKDGTTPTSPTTPTTGTSTSGTAAKVKTEKEKEPADSIKLQSREKLEKQLLKDKKLKTGKAEKKEAKASDKQGESVAVSGKSTSDTSISRTSNLL